MTSATIIVKFKDKAEEVTMPLEKFKELMWDKNVEYILDAETGEILMESMF